MIDRAANPGIGLASFAEFPNMAAFRKQLNIWAEDYWEDVQRERARLPALPEPPQDLEMESRIAKGLKELSEHLRRAPELPDGRKTG